MKLSTQLAALSIMFVVLTAGTAAVAATAAAGINSPAWPDQTIGSSFGVQAKPERTDDDTMTRIKQMGYSYIRYDMRWQEVERQRGRYSWGAFDTFIEKLRAHGLKSIVILNGGDPIYTGYAQVPPEKAFGFSKLTKAPSSDDDIKAFAAFAAAAVQRYGTKDIIWEIWNEPDNLAFWPPTPDPEMFAKLATASCQAMRAVAPDAAIVAPGVSQLPAAGGSETGSGFLAPLIKSPASQCLTALSIHPYRIPKSPETVIDDYKNKVRPFIASVTPQGQTPLSFISGEWGYPTNKISDEQQADYALREPLANLIAGVPLSIWYEWRDSRPGPAPDDMEAHFGLVDYDGKDKASATAVANLLPKIKDAVIEKRIPTANVNCYILSLRQPDGTHQLLAWVDNAQMMTGSNLVTGATSGDHTYPLTTRPQLFDTAADSHTTCQ